ncbi:tRNA selenocysteine 1-associated protein 1 [Nymphon striatum]|nr:tRNA selenocysteine 1-associated protein 1 [Nymphon striatum]
MDPIVLTGIFSPLDILLYPNIHYHEAQQLPYERLRRVLQGTKQTLEPYMDENFISESFKSMGESLFQCKIIKNKITGLPLGYGFLEFGDDQTALRTLHKCNGKMIPGSGPPKRFKLNHASYGKDQDFSIFVGDLTPEIDDLMLFNAFIARYPSTRSAKVVLDSDGTTKGYGFIRFAEEKEQQRALVEMQGSNALGAKPVRVSLATPKNKQVAQPMNVAAAPATNMVPTDYSAYYQASYQQQYQDYYQSSWQQYYNSYTQQQYDQYYNQQAAAVPAADGTYQYSQYGQGYAAGYPTSADAYNASYQSEEVELEEHENEVDIPKKNREYMAKNEEFYSTLSNSRWTSTEEDVCNQLRMARA